MPVFKRKSGQWAGNEGQRSGGGGGPAGQSQQNQTAGAKANDTHQETQNKRSFKQPTTKAKTAGDKAPMSSGVEPKIY